MERTHQMLRDVCRWSLREIAELCGTSDVLVRYPDGSALYMPMERAGRLYADEIGLKAIGREGFQLVLHRR